jgi:hypothetical protein
MQFPFEHAWPGWHTRPQLPQFCASNATFAQSVPHIIWPAPLHWPDPVPPFPPPSPSPSPLLGVSPLQPTNVTAEIPTAESNPSNRFMVASLSSTSGTHKETSFGFLSAESRLLALSAWLRIVEGLVRVKNSA